MTTTNVRLQSHRCHHHSVTMVSRCHCQKADTNRNRTTGRTAAPRKLAGGLPKIPNGGQELRDLARPPTCPLYHRPTRLCCAAVVDRLEIEWRKLCPPQRQLRGSNRLITFETTKWFTIRAVYRRMSIVKSGSIRSAADVSR